MLSAAGAKNCPQDAVGKAERVAAASAEVYSLDWTDK